MPKSRVENHAHNSFSLCLKICLGIFSREVKVSMAGPRNLDLCLNSEFRFSFVCLFFYVHAFSFESVWGPGPPWCAMAA